MRKKSPKKIEAVPPAPAIAADPEYRMPSEPAEVVRSQPWVQNQRTR